MVSLVWVAILVFLGSSLSRSQNAPCPACVPVGANWAHVFSQSDNSQHGYPNSTISLECTADGAVLTIISPANSITIQPWDLILNQPASGVSANCKQELQRKPSSDLPLAPPAVNPQIPLALGEAPSVWDLNDDYFNAQRQSRARSHSGSGRSGDDDYVEFEEELGEGAAPAPAAAGAVGVVAAASGKAGSEWTWSSEYGACGLKPSPTCNGESYTLANGGFLLTEYLDVHGETAGEIELVTVNAISVDCAVGLIPPDPSNFKPEVKPDHTAKCQQTSYSLAATADSDQEVVNVAVGVVSHVPNDQATGWGIQSLKYGADLVVIHGKASDPVGKNIGISPSAQPAWLPGHVGYGVSSDLVLNPADEQLAVSAGIEYCLNSPTASEAITNCNSALLC